MSHFLRTQSIYAYILQCHKQNDLPPTMREIADACHLPLSTIFRHLDWLEARGYIIRDHTTRSLRPLKPLLSDEEVVYMCLAQFYKVSSSAPSLNTLYERSHLSFSRVKAALDSLAQSGRIQSDSENPYRFYPIEVDS